MTRFLAQFFPPGRTTKLQNDILMFQQYHGESLSEAWTCFKDLLQKVPHHVIDLCLQVQIFFDHVNPATRQTIDQAAGGKLRDKNTKESLALLEDLALYDERNAVVLVLIDKGRMPGRGSSIVGSRRLAPEREQEIGTQDIVSGEMDRYD
nr:zinc finger, CCHC-type [Tanacetum cinerariifolium]